MTDNSLLDKTGFQYCFHSNLATLSMIPFVYLHFHQLQMIKVYKKECLHATYIIHYLVHFIHEIPLYKAWKVKYLKNVCQKYPYLNFLFTNVDREEWCTVCCNMQKYSQAFQCLI